MHTILHCQLAYIAALFPYVIITAMVIRGCTLKGAWKGIKFYLQPQLSKITEISVCML